MKKKKKQKTREGKIQVEEEEKSQTISLLLLLLLDPVFVRPSPPPQHHNAGFHAEGHPALRAHHLGLAVSVSIGATQRKAAA